MSLPDYSPAVEQPISREAFVLATLDFIAQTATFYATSQRLAMEHGISVPRNNLKAMDMSVATVNACLETVGGFDHYFTEPSGATHEVKLTKWNGPDRADSTKHSWVVSGPRGIGRASIDASAVEELRAKTLDSLGLQ